VSNCVVWKNNLVGLITEQFNFDWFKSGRLYEKHAIATIVSVVLSHCDCFWNSLSVTRIHVGVVGPSLQCLFRSLITTHKTNSGDLSRVPHGTRWDGNLLTIWRSPPFTTPSEQGRTKALCMYYIHRQRADAILVVVCWLEVSTHADGLATGHLNTGFLGFLKFIEIKPNCC
jgi:hypothetical protein